jgi:23S rRNA pseudouridine955/2504/2580 synthase
MKQTMKTDNDKYKHIKMSGANASGYLESRTMKTETPSVKMVAIAADEAGQRIDNFLRTQLKGVPKSMIYRILRKGEVRVNKKRVKPEYKLEAGDEVRIPPVRVAEREEEASPASAESGGAGRCDPV